MHLKYYKAPASQCSYLPKEQWSLLYAISDELNNINYRDLIDNGWRRFGDLLFRPDCSNCKACIPIRVLVNEFKPNRSQRRVINKNTNLIQLKIQDPILDEEHINLYLRHHKHHNITRDWPLTNKEEAFGNIIQFTKGRLPVQEWAYYVDSQLVAVSYVDEFRDAYSGMYFYHSPEHKHLSLGTLICLSLIEEAKKNKLDYVFFGYYIAGCLSMEYKANFKPYQLLQEDGSWK